MGWFVNDELVDDVAVREEARAMRATYIDANSNRDPIDAEIQLHELARENVFKRVLLRQQAMADSEPAPSDVIERRLTSVRTGAGGRSCNGGDELREQVELQYRVERLVMRVQKDTAPPLPKDISEYYKANKERFWTPELVHATHVVKNVNEDQDEQTARAAIERALEELRSGADFAEVANRHSDCAGNGGDLGWFPRGQMVEEFENVVFALSIGAMSDIFRSQFGFHIAKVLGRRAAGIRAFPEVKDDIEEALWRRARERMLQNYLDGLLASSNIRRDSTRAQ